MIKQVYLDIQSACATILDNNNQPLIKHFDLWNQNVDFIDEDRRWNRPAIFVEFKPIRWQTAGQKVQEAVVDIHLHIVTDWYGQTQRDSPKQAQALEYLNIPDKVVGVLQNKMLTLSGCLTRTQSLINHNHERYLDSVEVYQAHIRDNSALITYPEQVPAQVGLKILTE